MKISNNNFFYRGEPSQWEITTNHLDCIRELKPSFYEGAYVDRGLSYEYDTNYHIFNKYADGMPIDEFINNVSISMQLIVRMINMDDLSKNIHFRQIACEIKLYHINLIKRLYISEDYDGNGGIYTADKRPFGNSYMIGDVIDEMGVGSSLSRLNAGEDIDETPYIKVYNEVIDLAIKIFREFKPPFTHFIFAGRKWSSEKQIEQIKLTELQRKYLNHDWTIDIIGQRDKIIDSIIS